MGSQRYTADDYAANRKAGEVFHDKLDIWMKHGNGRVLIDGKPVKRTQSSFGKMIYPDMKKPQSQISKWYNAKLSKEPPRIPEDKLNMIIEIFNNDGIPTTREEFKIHNDDYRYNTEAVNKYIKDKYDRFLNDISIEGFSEKTNRIFNKYFKSFHAFLLFIKTLKNYDSEFPLWTRIIHNNDWIIESDELTFSEYTRAPYNTLPDAAPTDTLKEFQVDKGKDGIKVLQDEDIKYLIKLYGKVKDFIYEDFKQHKEELKDGASKAIIASAIRSLHDEDDHNELTDEELCLIDSYFAEAYLNSEYNKYTHNEEGDEK